MGYGSETLGARGATRGEYDICLFAAAHSPDGGIKTRVADLAGPSKDAIVWHRKQDTRTPNCQIPRCKCGGAAQRVANVLRRQRMSGMVAVWTQAARGRQILALSGQLSRSTALSPSFSPPCSRAASYAIAHGKPSRTHNSSQPTFRWPLQCDAREFSERPVSLSFATTRLKLTRGPLAVARKSPGGASYRGLE